MKIKDAYNGKGKWAATIFVILWYCLLAGIFLYVIVGSIMTIRFLINCFR